MLREKSKFVLANSGSGIIVVRKNIVQDSQFPFKVGDILDVRLDVTKKMLIIKKQGGEKDGI